VPPRRGDPSVPEHRRHVCEVDAALPELQRDAVARLVGPHVLRLAGRVQRLDVVAAVERAHAAATNGFHAATMSSFNQNARGSPPFAVLTIHALRSRSTSADSARFNSAGRTPVDAMTMNRARVFASVRLLATVRKVFAATRIFGEGATGSGTTSSAGVGALDAVQVPERLHPVIHRLRGVLLGEPRSAGVADVFARDLRAPQSRPGVDPAHPRLVARQRRDLRQIGCGVICERPTR
jgi:hypothetical protein